MLPGQPVSRLDVVTDQLLFAATGGYRRTIDNGVQLPDSGAIYRSSGWRHDLDAGVCRSRERVSDVSFANANNGAATRNDGAILYTNDGGSTWTPAIQFSGPSSSRPWSIGRTGPLRRRLPHRWERGLHPRSAPMVA